MKLAIVGCRYFNNSAIFDSYMTTFIQKHGLPQVVVSGGASGIDTLAEKWARFHDIPTEIYPADWKKYGRKAGPLRNEKIVAASDFILAFPSKTSVGTYDTINKGKMADKPVEIICL